MKIRQFGVEISHIEYEEFISQSLERKSGYSCFLNSHMLYEHYNNPSFKNVLKEADFVLTDGVPVLYTFMLFQRVSQSRIAGNDVMFSLLRKASKENLKVFLLGSTSAVLDRISNKLKTLNVNHQTYSPPFKPINDFDFEEQASLISSFDPDMVLVGLGCPKQEIWMHQMKRRINVPMYGLGGAFLLYAGLDKRAPKWMRTLSLEWVYRMALEPTRLFKRYLITNSYFCWLFTKEIFSRIWNR